MYNKTVITCGFCNIRNNQGIWLRMITLTSTLIIPDITKTSSNSCLIFPNFQNCVRCKKDLKDNKDNSSHLGQKYARIFVLVHYLFLVAHSFARASLLENCSLLGTDNVRRQISEHIFVSNGDYCLCICTPEDRLDSRFSRNV